MFVMIPVAVGLAALINATQLWVDIVFHFVVVTLLFATYKAKVSAGIVGAWWTGFAAFGWLQLVFGMPRWERVPVLVTISLAVWFEDYLGLDSSAEMFEKLVARGFIIKSMLSLLVGFLGATIFGLSASRRTTSERGLPSG